MEVGSKTSPTEKVTGAGPPRPLDRAISTAAGAMSTAKTLVTSGSVDSQRALSPVPVRTYTVSDRIGRIYPYCGWHCCKFTTHTCSHVQNAAFENLTRRGKGWLCLAHVPRHHSARSCALLVNYISEVVPTAPLGQKPPSAGIHQTRLKSTAHYGCYDARDVVFKGSLLENAFEKVSAHTKCEHGSSCYRCPRMVEMIFFLSPFSTP
jgi:hypothetical protein